jgi:triphosphoribosyl-dephospho-CoA synthase
VTVERARASFLRACWLDVAVRKPGNVSLASAGHGMEAQMFIDSAQAAAPALFKPGLGVGARIEGAVEATWAVAGCNTNLGILLLCAPIALAIERQPGATTPAALQAAVESVLAALDIEDARAAFRAIARAHPGGLGTAPSEDVRNPPTTGLRCAMALAAERDFIAKQYRDGFADVFALTVQGLEFLLPPLGLSRKGISPSPSRGGQGWGSAGAQWNQSLSSAVDPHPRPPPEGEGVLRHPLVEGVRPSAATVAFVQRLYLSFLSRTPDSHIVRNHGEQVAQTVMTAAQTWRERERAGAVLDGDPDFIAWDESLKAARINPGTSADLTVAALMLAGWIASAAPPARDAAGGWHGS